MGISDNSFSIWQASAAVAPIAMAAKTSLCSNRMAEP